MNCVSEPGRWCNLATSIGWRLINAFSAAQAMQHGNVSLSDDVLDDLGELVLRNGGEVAIVPAERVPTQSGLAAIQWF